MAYDRRWLEEQGSYDCQARALWALATVISRSRQEGLRQAAGRLFDVALPIARNFTDLRPAAFTLIGLNDYLQHFTGDRAAQETRRLLAERLYTAYQRNTSAEWPWFEDKLTYANAALPHALLLCGRSLGLADWTEAALQSLKWLMEVQTSPGGHFAPIGNHGFYSRGAAPARFDQQPIEAQVSISACLEAYRATDNEDWRHHARCIFEWFLGRNDQGVSLYIPATGGCSDGLSATGASANQGAESTLAFLLSLAELRLFEQAFPAEKQAAASVSRNYFTRPVQRESLEKVRT